MKNNMTDENRKDSRQAVLFWEPKQYTSTSQYIGSQLFYATIKNLGALDVLNSKKTFITC